MTVLAYVLIGGALLFIGAIAYRRMGRGRAAADIPSASLVGAIEPPIEVPQLEAVNTEMAHRLWKLAFGAPSQPPPLVRAHARVRDLICAILQVDTLDPSYFPRRPTLLPQLIQAVNDPAADSERISRMIARDPVLTADVLRLANSSLYRASPAPIETIQRAITVCGVDALRGMLATAMLRPVFRASRTNFPRLPRMLWDRTERAARAAELYAAKVRPEDRFEAQLVVLLSALGPLVVYGAALDGYSRAPQLTPNPSLFVDLVDSLSLQMSQRIARDWETSPRLSAALEKSGGETLTTALRVGELLGTLSFFESQTIIARKQRLEVVKSAGIPQEIVDGIWPCISGKTLSVD